MIKKSTLALTIAAALASSSAIANTISGKVIDPQGNPVANAEVDVIGAAAKAKTDELGRFTLNNVPVREVELHLAARRFGHNNVKLSVPAAGLTDVELRLTADLLAQHIIQLEQHDRGDDGEDDDLDLNRRHWQSLTGGRRGDRARRQTIRG